jgi:gamma-glutamylcysteine synthetase
LEKQHALDSEGRDETIYLQPLDQQLRSGASPGRYTAERWERSWNEDVKYLITFASYREDD